MGLRSIVLVSVFLVGFQILRASSFELLWSDDAEFSGPATGLMEETWTGEGAPRFNSDGNFFGGGGFSGTEAVEGLPFPVFVEGGAILKLTGTNAWNATYADRDFGVVDAVYPFDGGGLILEANPIIYLSEGGIGTPSDLGKDSLAILGVGQNNGRVIFQEKQEGPLANISAFLPSEATRLVAVENGPAPGTTATIAEFLQFPQRLHYNRDGRVAFFARLEGEGVTFMNDRAIFFESETFELEMLVRSGDIFPTSGIPGSDGAVFIDAVPLMGLNDEGRVAFMGTVTTNVVPSGRIDSLWEISPTGEKSLVVADRVPMETASGGEVTFSGLFQNLEQPIVDQLGNIYFSGNSLTADGLSTEKTLWRKESAGLVKLLTFDNDSLSLPASRLSIDNGDGTITKFTVVYERLKSMQVSDDGRVAFVADFEELERRLDSDGNVISNGRTRTIGEGLWAQDVEGDWEFVAARIGRPANDDDRPISPAERFRLSNAEASPRIWSFIMPFWTPDVSGNGYDGLVPSWWLPDGRLLVRINTFDAEVGLKNYVVAATVEETIETGTGVTYIWDEGINGIDWHEIEDNKTNWVDAFGVRWATPPTTLNAEVTIPKGPDSNPFHVELLQAVPEIASIEVDGILELNAALKVRESTIINGDLFQRENSSLISEGDVEVDGDVVSWKDGIRTIAMDSSHTITTKGMINGNETGIWAKSDNGMLIENEATLSGDQSAGILAESDDGLIFILNKGDISSSNSSAIRAISVSGPIEIQSPELDGAPVVIRSTGDGIKATTDGPIDIVFNGESNSGALTPGMDAFSLHAESTGGPVSIRSKGSLTGTSPGFGAGGIWAKGTGDVYAKHEGRMNVSGQAIIGRSSDGNVIVDGRDAFISSDFGGLKAEAPNGTATVYGGEMGTGQGKGIWVEASGEITVTSDGPIQTVSGILNVSSSGIHTVSSDGGITISSSEMISTSHIAPSDAIYAKASTDITIVNNGSLSTFAGAGMWVESTTGNVEIKHEGLIAPSNLGNGIRATSESGTVMIVSNDLESAVASKGESTIRHAIHASAGGSVSVSWAGDIQSFSSGANGIFAHSETAGVLVTTRGEVSAVGTNGDGVFLSGPSNLTLNILGGSISGSDGLGVGVRFSDGADNKITNHGTISSFSGLSVQAGERNEAIDNFGGIGGNINLGGGTNVLTNHPGSELFSNTEFNLGAGNTFDNSGLFQIGEEGEAVVTTVLTGNWVQQSSARFHVEFQDPNLGSSLTVSESATVAGKLSIRLQDDYEPMSGNTFTLITADSLSGAFDSVRVFEGSVNNPPISRTVKVDLSYTPTSVVAMVEPVLVESYDDWSDLVFSEEEQADELISGPDANPDGDYMSNGDESLFGGDPLAPDGSPVSFDLGDVNAAGGIQISATFNVAGDITDRDWFFETSSNMKDWSEASVTETIMQDMGDFSQMTVEFDEPIPNTGSTFVRLKSRAISL